MGLPAGWKTSSHMPVLLLLLLILSLPASLRHYSCLPLWWSCNSNHSALITRQWELIHTHIPIDCWFTLLPVHVLHCREPSGVLDSAFFHDVLSLLNLTLQTCLSFPLLVFLPSVSFALPGSQGDKLAPG